MQENVTVAPSAPVVQIAAGPGNSAQTIAVPQSVQEIAGLRSRRSELGDQLERAWNRRQNITEEISEASGVEREGLELRLTVMDQRIAQIEGDIAGTERALTSAQPALLASAAQAEEAAEAAREAARPMLDDEFVGVLAVISMLMLVPFVFAYTRRIWKRAPAARALPAAAESRLERIEQAVESIAVEVERVSEGQRFVTRLMSDGRNELVGDRSRMIPDPRRSAS